jgi:hypothetical protein
MSRSTKTVRTLAVSLALALAATACAPGGLDDRRARR